jgi:serine/threonine protein kinase
MQAVTESHIYTDPVSEAFCPKCGEPLSVEGLPAFTSVECPKCSHLFQVPARFGPFLLIELLGAGGMGGVYRAKDEGLNREVAIKVMLQSLGDDIDFVETFQREAQAAAKLNNPHIAQIYSFGQQYGQPYIVMELVSHGSLEQLMEERGGVEPAVAMQIGGQIAEGLREAAEAGLVHGDVKPENILFDEEGNAKLVDFGLVALSAGNENEVWGTPFYIAPEKVRRQKSDYRSDIYSLGATLYHAIANKPPFDGPDATAVVKARFEGPPKPLSAVTGKEIPPEVEALIQRMLELDPAKRYPTYGSLLGDMKRFISKAGPINLKKSSRRIQIKGKQAVKFDRHAPKSAVTGRVPHSDAVDALLEEESVQAQGCRKMVVFGILALIGMTILGGIITAAVFVNKKKAAEREFAAMQDRQQKLVAAGLKAVDVAGKNAAKVKKFTPEALRYADEAANVAITVFGEEVRPRMVPPRPEFALAEIDEALPAAAASSVVGAVSNQVAAALSNQVAGAVADAPSVASRVKVEQPEGELPRDDDHPVIKTVRRMYLDAYAVELAGFVADQVVAELEKTQAELEELQTVPLADKKMAEIYEGMKNKVAGMSYLPEIKDVANMTANLKTARSSVLSDLESLEMQRRLEKAEQERLARKAEEENRKRAQADALKQKVLDEKARIGVVEGECIESIVNLRFSSALRMLNDLTNELGTDKGRLALLTAKERVSRIEEFHNYIVGKASGYKSSRGWVISEADERWLVVGKTKMFWKDFYAERYVEAADLISASVGPQVKEQMRIREHTRLLTNAALFLSVFYPDKPGAQEFARKLANEAAGQFEVEADTVKSLLPQFFGEQPAF